jgi:hypothetical protein
MALRWRAWPGESWGGEELSLCRQAGSLRAGGGGGCSLYGVRTPNAVAFLVTDYMFPVLEGRCQIEQILRHLWMKLRGAFVFCLLEDLVSLYMSEIGPSVDVGFSSGAIVLGL